MQQSEMMRAPEAARYIGRSVGSLYVLTSQNLIPFCKPRGKILLFRRSELDRWIEAGRVPTVDEVREQAASRSRRRA